MQTLKALKPGHGLMLMSMIRKIRRILRFGKRKVRMLRAGVKLLIARGE